MEERDAAAVEGCRIGRITDITRKRIADPIVPIQATGADPQDAVPIFSDGTAVVSSDARPIVWLRNVSLESIDLRKISVDAAPLCGEPQGPV